ncbi:MAG: TMEM165/GDT1 family protein [Candidatus Omnitrophota bacterium]|nr:TMEM165/GDT1 family protein [Candidatus Omnitrophota bacterium]
MAAFIASFIFVVLAEMGDKTQLLAMAFAAKYKAHQVLLAVFIATILNHALAVMAGRFLTTIIPLDIISFIAALSFVIFGIWTIRGDKLDGEENKASKFGPVLTVAIAFFIAEMGDKTQLATISLAVEYSSMLNVLMGTTLGMVVADAIGIIIGVVMRKHIPQKFIKWFSAGIFVLFGLAGIYKVLVAKMSPAYIWIVISFILICVVAAARYIVKLKDR